MKKLVSILLFIFIFIPVSVSADTIDIYCPKCYKLLWTLNYENPLTLDDFKIDNIIKGELSEKLVCPFDNVPVNGWEYWAWERGMHPPVMVYPALTVMTLNEQGEFVWFPDNVEVSNF